MESMKTGEKRAEASRRTYVNSICTGIVSAVAIFSIFLIHLAKVAAREEWAA